jgi:hypothetical protein
MLSGQPGTINVTFSGDGAPRPFKATCTLKPAGGASSGGETGATAGTLHFSCGKAIVVIHDGGKTLDWSDTGEEETAVTSPRDTKQTASTRTSYSDFKNADLSPSVTIDNSMLSGQPGTINVTFSGDGAPRPFKATCTSKGT